MKHPPQALKPRRLCPGDTIGVVAPASPFDRQEFEQGLTLLAAMGFRICLAPGVFECQGYLAGSDAQRTAQLTGMLTDERVDAVICARGGFGSLRILSDLDWDRVGLVPKPLIGFSDISALHQALYFKMGWVGFHGPMVCSLAKADPETQKALVQALTADRPWTLAAEHRRVIQAGRAEGILVGGNLTTLCHLVGTPYAATYEDCILFIEDIGEAPYRIDRMLLQMRLAGCFSGLSGVALGSFQNCGSETDIHTIISELFGRWDIPVLAGFAMGHTTRNLTWPIGIRCCLDTDCGSIALMESVTAPK